MSNTSFVATGIGSIPYEDADKACNLILNTLPEAPFWPQLPKRGMREQMEIQYSEGMPCAVIDAEKKRMYFQTAGDYSEAFAVFYEAYLTAMDQTSGNGDCSAMAISPDFSAGIQAMESRLKTDGTRKPFVKVQTVGPCSFALTITDENKRAIFYNDEFRDMIVKALAMKCRWQIQKFRPFAEKIVCFIDEPILSAFGSSTYVSVKRGDVIAPIKEVVEAVHADGALAGVHCCGNTDWSLLVEAGVDIISLDAFGFGETLAMYPEAVARHLDGGGLIAWGIVPTSAAIREQTVGGLRRKLENLVDLLASKGISKDIVLSRSWLTPSCGTGSMEPADAERVLGTLNLLAADMKATHKQNRGNA